MHGYLSVPLEWEQIESRRIGVFVTSETFRRPDGRVVTWDSRTHRKRGRGDPSGSTWWAPRALGWWVAVLFIVGSACFVVGPAPGYLAWVGFTADAVTFFVGSLFFTSAALLQYIEVAAAPAHRGRRAAARSGARYSESRRVASTGGPRRCSSWARCTSTSRRSRR